jgi:hypothetical protein
MRKESVGKGSCNKLSTDEGIGMKSGRREMAPDIYGLSIATDSELVKGEKGDPILGHTLGVLTTSADLERNDGPSVVVNLVGLRGTACR